MPADWLMHSEWRRRALAHVSGARLVPKSGGCVAPAYDRRWKSPTLWACGAFPRNPGPSDHSANSTSKRSKTVGICQSNFNPIVGR
jgi:hypothetical protein